PGCTYGGLLVPRRAKADLVQQIVRAIMAYARECSFDRLVITPPPELYHRDFCQQIDFVLQMEEFDHRLIGLSTCVPLDGRTDEDLSSALGSNCAWAVRKGKRDGVEVSETDDFSTFWEILRENLSVHGVSPVHSVQEIRVLQERFPDRIRLFGAFLDGAMVAGSVVFLATETVAHTQYLGAQAQVQQHRPMNVLIWEIMRWARDQGMKWINFGVSTESEGRVVNWGLLRFKESFGGVGVVHRRYRLDLGRDGVNGPDE
ncbi:MAG: GNAT family N-acetyltransferase, partial [bacterium]